MSDFERFLVNCPENGFFGAVDVFVFWNSFYKISTFQLWNLPKSRKMQTDLLTLKLFCGKIRAMIYQL